MEAKCRYIEACPMYKHFSLKAVKEMYITQYCEGDFDQCERKKLRDSGNIVPEKLLPNGKSLI